MGPLLERRASVGLIALLLALVAQRVVGERPALQDSEATGAPVALDAFQDLPLVVPVHEATRTTRVDVSTLRSGAREGEASGCLMRLVRVHHGPVARTLHLETHLPGLACRVHLVESRDDEGRRQLVHRERTADAVRSIRIDVDPDGLAELVIHGEGEALRRTLVLPAGTVGPLERLEAERAGTATDGDVWILDPLSGSVRALVAERRVLANGTRVPLTLWTLADRAGAIESATLLLGDVLVARRPAPGRPLVRALDPERFDELLGSTEP